MEKPAAGAGKITKIGEGGFILAVLISSALILLVPLGWLIGGRTELFKLSLLFFCAIPFGIVAAYCVMKSKFILLAFLPYLFVLFGFMGKLA